MLTCEGDAGKRKEIKHSAVISTVSGSSSGREIDLGFVNYLVVSITHPYSLTLDLQEKTIKFSATWLTFLVSYKFFFRLIVLES